MSDDVMAGLHALRRRLEERKARLQVLDEVSERVLSETPERHKRERIYQTMEAGPREARVSAYRIRLKLGDTGTSEVRRCGCGQLNRINLRSTHDGDIGPRCGRCKAAL